MLDGLLNDNLIALDFYASDKNDALRKIAQHAFDTGIVDDTDNFYNGLMQREAEATTGFGYGIAIPHAKVSSVKAGALMCFKFEQPLNWDSLDDQPVDTALVIAMPEFGGHNNHLAVLAILARKIMHEEFRKQLKHAATTKEILDVLTLNEV